MTDPKGARCRAACAACDKETIHQILSSIEHYYNLPDVQAAESYETIQCCGCEQLSFRKVVINYYNSDYDEDKGGWYLPEEVFLYPPKAIEKLQIRNELWLLPPDVRRIFDEVYLAICHDCRILAVLGIRVILESVCLEKKVKGSKLDDKINDLVKEGIVTSKQAEILHHLRKRGNDAAHDISLFDEATVHAGFDIIQHLLTSVYILSHRAEKIERKDKPPVKKRGLMDISG